MYKSNWVRDFEDNYEANVAVSQRRYRRVKRATHDALKDWYYKGIADSYTTDNQIEDVEMTEILLPHDRLEDLLLSQQEVIYARQREEALLRDRYPALQSAWEQYQIVLAMVK
jgi:hypothetical protein